VRSFAAAVRAEPTPTVPVKMNHGGGHRGNFGAARDGFGAGRQGRGSGRTQGCNLTWERTIKEVPACEEARPEDGKNQATENEKWEGQKDPKNTKEEPWGNKGVKDVAESSQGNKARQALEDHPDPQHNQIKIPYAICGLFNHVTQDCRRLNCEICGVNGHMAYDCKRCIPWNCGPELCATQVEDQSFFYIEENIDPRMAKEKECTAIISVLSGNASGKDIEKEFANHIGSSTWRWAARSIDDNKYMMRFLNAKAIRDWSHFPMLAMRYVNAQIKVEAYTSSFGAKATLQQAWFRI